MLSVTRKDNEKTMGVVRRFTQKVRRSGIVRYVRSNRFSERAPSKLTRKLDALRRIEKNEKYKHLKKWGKV